MKLTNKPFTELLENRRFRLAAVPLLTASMSTNRTTEGPTPSLDDSLVVDQPQTWRGALIIDVAVRLLMLARVQSHQTLCEAGVCSDKLVRNKPGLP